MRLSVVHDSQGNLLSLAAYPDDAPPAYLETRAGEFLAELDAPDLSAKLAADKVHAQLSDMLANYRLDRGAKPKLVRR